jgi:alkanesulfonate monooxygenase SsuD/methylene tetrahydromethanopterin reductase-like flavin-dependent oxidoreductase (luciferase family)
MTGCLSVPLSVLDLCPVPAGESTGEALRRSVDLACRAEQWGLRRYWVAEHHSMPAHADRLASYELLARAAAGQTGQPSSDVLAL